MLVLGKITILVDDEPKGARRKQYGFIKVKDMEEEIFFNALSSFQDTSFENLKIGDKVYISFKQTDQGPFAESLSLSKYQKETAQKEASSPPEASL